MRTTENFNLNLAEGTDKVNPLTVDVPNYETIDEAMEINRENSIVSATETKSENTHLITVLTTKFNYFKFTATSDFRIGDLFTVNGTGVTATYVDNSSLDDYAFRINSEVICSLKGTKLTVYANKVGSTISEDSKKLGGQLPEYYGKAINSVIPFDFSVVGSENRLTSTEYSSGVIFGRTFFNVAPVNGTWKINGNLVNNVYIGITTTTAFNDTLTIVSYINKPIIFIYSGESLFFIPETGFISINGGTFKGGVTGPSSKFDTSITNKLFFGDNYSNYNISADTVSTGDIDVVSVGGLKIKDSSGNLLPVKASNVSGASSRRYKENIRDMDDETAMKILNMASVIFNYKPELNDPGTKYGFIAEDVAKIDDSYVYKNKDGQIEGINYSMIIPAIVHLLKKLF